MAEPLIWQGLAWVLVDELLVCSNFFAVPPVCATSWAGLTSHHGTDKPLLSRYLTARMSRPLYVVLARFPLAAHSLAVVQNRRARPQVPYLLKMCPLEEGNSPFCQEVQDEVHAVFHCEFAPIIELRQLFAGLFENVPQHSNDLRTFTNQSNALAVASFISRLLRLCMVA